MANIPASGGESKRRMPLMRKFEKQCDQWHLAFCGGGCVATTQVPRPKAKLKNIAINNLLQKIQKKDQNETTWQEQNP